MKQIIFVMSMIAALLVSCAGEPASEGAVTETEDPQTEAAITDSPAVSAAADKPPKEAVETGQRTVYQPPQNDDILYLSFGKVTVDAGKESCVSLTARGFTQLLSNQYTVSWDPAVLQFVGIRDFNLPKLSMQNFGSTQTDKGILPFVWIDATLKGVSIPDGQVLYSICFKAVGSAGQSSEIRLVEQPTPFEVVTAKEELQELSPAAGRITIQ